MLTLDDPHWNGLKGGYRLVYDPRPALRRLLADSTDRAAWEELWQELHHQGDVGEVSYAAVVTLVEIAREAEAGDWNPYALASTIEVARHATDNPPVPEWLAENYSRAWADLKELALTRLQLASDPYVIRSALAVVALARGQVKLGILLSEIDDSELDDYLGAHGWLPDGNVQEVNPSLGGRKAEPPAG